LARISTSVKKKDSSELRRLAKIGSKESPCITIPKTQGEKTLGLVHKMGLSNRELRIQNEDLVLHVPLVRRLNKEEKAVLKAQLPNFTLETRTFSKKFPPNKTLRHILENQLQPSLLRNLPRAFDIIGDIAIIEIPSELKQKETLVGKAILESHQKVKTVFAKAGAVTGTYRLRELIWIAGEQKTTTIHKEYGCAYAVDVAKAYFSPRLSQEHKRIASLTQKGEMIVDLFAGVGPFSVLISRINPDVKIYAIDINPEAIKLLETNVRLNRVENRVFPTVGDATKTVEEKLAGIADRVIMNLPESAIEFVGAACRAMKPTGGVVHFYGFVRQSETLEDMQKRFREKVEKTGRRVDRLLGAKKVRETAPYEWQVAIDARIL
jgi:tRNA (guanine37-N1)-methyltransferase